MHEEEQAKLPEAGQNLIHGGKVMSLWDHLDELRTRIIRGGLAVLVIFFIAYAFSSRILIILKQPLADALPPEANVLHFTGPMDVFMVNIKVAFLVAIIAGCPIWLYQFWRFVEPAMYPGERKYVLPFIISSVGLFFLGVLFCFELMLPFAMKYLIGIGLEVGTPIITVTDYISLVTVLILGFGLMFETPLILVLLALLDFVSADALAKNRRIVIVGILVAAAVLTPPDPISQIAMAVPVYIMYEISIIIIRLIKGKGRADPS